MNFSLTCRSNRLRGVARSTHVERNLDDPKVEVDAILKRMRMNLESKRNVIQSRVGWW
jgi:hypothetical protein